MLSVILDATRIIKLQEETQVSSAIAKWGAAQSVYSMLSIQGKFYYQERHKYKEFIIKHEKSFVSTLKSLNAQYWKQEVKQTNLVF